MLKSPGHRRIREGKKCRKVYGLEQRDLWCTQCKWKKACARFAKPSTASAASNSETSATSLLIPAAGAAAVAANSQNAVRAIKFWTTLLFSWHFLWLHYWLLMPISLNLFVTLLTMLVRASSFELLVWPLYYISTLLTYHLPTLC